MDKKRLENIGTAVEEKAFKDHGHEFMSLGVTMPEQYRQHYIDTLKNPETLVFTGMNNRDLYFNNKNNTFSVDNMDYPTQETHFRKGSSKKGYDSSQIGERDFYKQFDKETKRAAEAGKQLPKITTVGQRVNALGVQRGINGVGAVFAAENLVDAHERGDVAGQAVAVTNITSSLSNEVLAAARAAGRPLALGVESLVKRGNIVATVADGAYRISQEQGREHQLERAAAVTATAGAGLAAGSLFAAGVGAGGAAVAIAVAAPIVVAGTVAVAADKAIELHRAVQELDNFKATIPNRPFDASVAYYPNLSTAINIQGAKDVSANPQLAAKGIENVNDPAWLREKLTAQETRLQNAEDKKGWFEKHSIVPDDDKLNLHQTKAALAELSDYEKKLNASAQLESAAKNLTAKGGSVKDDGCSAPIRQNLDNTQITSQQAGRC